MAELEGDGFVWELWKDEGRRGGFRLKKQFPDGNWVVVEQGMLALDPLGVNYDVFLADLMSRRSEEE
ncbi:MAG: hypothetical protein WB919_23120 [Candidatus Sulfotelmatobacter sp.]